MNLMLFKSNKNIQQLAEFFSTKYPPFEAIKLSNEFFETAQFSNEEKIEIIQRLNLLPKGSKEKLTQVFVKKGKVVFAR